MEITAQGFLARAVRTALDKVRYKPPTVLWEGFEADAGPALRTVLENTTNDKPEDLIRVLQREDKTLDYEIEDLKQEIRRIQERINNKKRRKNDIADEVAREQARLESGEPAISDDQIAQLIKAIRRIRGVLGIRLTYNGSIEIIVRTAIRDYRGNLYDMGDYQITLPKSGLNRVYRGYEDIANVLQLTCVRLPRDQYAEYSYRDHRLHHHYGEVRRRGNGTLYLEGGTFCVGGRKSEIIAALQAGEVVLALNLVVASLNDSQDKDEYTVHQYFGPQVLPKFEQAFFQNRAIDDVASEEEL